MHARLVTKDRPAKIQSERPVTATRAAMVAPASSRLARTFVLAHRDSWDYAASSKNQVQAFIILCFVVVVVVVVMLL